MSIKGRVETVDVRAMTARQPFLSPIDKTIYT